MSKVVPLSASRGQMEYYRSTFVERFIMKVRLCRDNLRKGWNMARISISRLILSAFLCLTLGGCAVIFPKSNTSLKLEEHQLSGAPEPGPLSFQPLDGTQEEILAKHADERTTTVSNEAFSVDGNPAISSLGDKNDLKAVVLSTNPGQPEQTVKLLRGDEIIFEAPGGLPSPAVPVQALWTYDGHWALEILYSDQSTWAGKIYIDGSLINEQKGYDEAFGFQLLADKPFFFYMRNGQVGYSYDGNETELNFSYVPHYNCCAESLLNPTKSQKMVAFFAQRDSTWYYVELGVFN